MKHLLDYCKWFFEDGENDQLRKQIIDYVDPSKSNKEEISNKVLYKAYQTLQSLDSDSFKKLKEVIFKGNKNGFDELVKLLEKLGNKINVMKALLEKQKNNFPTFDDLLKNSGKTLFDVILKEDFIKIFNNNKESAHEFIKQLLNIKYKDANDKGVGRGELCLFTLFQNTENATKGDVKIGGKDIEVKMSTSNSANGGRVMASNLNLKSPKDMAKYAEEKYNLKNISIGGPSVLDKLVNNFENKKDAFIKLSDMYLYQFPWYEDYKEKFNKVIEDLYEDNKKLGDQLIRIHGCLALIEYHTADKWNYLFVGNTSNSKYYMIDGTKCSLNSFENNMKELYNDNHFVFKDGPSNSAGANNRNYVSRIYVS